MGHKCCGKLKVKRGLWSPEEDEKLTKHITAHGHGSWSSVPKQAGLQRCGKSCRLRWINYLRPELKRGSFTAEEEQIIIDVHRILGNRWAQIAKHLPGRTDNEVKNFWNSCIKKKMISQGLDPKTHNLIPSHKRTTKKVSMADMPLSHQHPFSVITLTDSHILEGDVSLQITTTQPIPKLASHQYSSTNYTNPLQNNNVQWPIHNPEKYSTNATIENTPVCPPVASSADPPASFGLLDENQSEGLNSIVEPFVSSRVEGIQELQREDKQGTDNICYKEMEDLRKGKFAWDNRMDSHSLDASNFDLEFVESSLLSGLICTRDLCSMDGLAWNF